MNKQLQAARKARNWTQLQASLKAGIDYRQYRRYERGKSRPTPRSLQKLCNAFGMTGEELGFGKEESLSR